MYTYGRKTGCRISLDYTYKGMRIAYLENALLRVGVLLDKGADIFEFTYKPRDLDFMWQSPTPMQKPFIATSALPNGAFHDYYYGGWQEVLPSAGFSPEPYRDVYQGLHGEVSLLPFEAQIAEDTPDCVSLRARVRLYRTPLALVRTMTLRRDAAALFIHERLENESPGPFAIMWGHHPAFGEPFLDESCMVHIPASQVDVLDFHPNGQWQPGQDYAFPLVRNRRNGALEDVTRVLPRANHSVDLIYFKGLAEGWYGLTNQRQGIGFGMAWDASLFRSVWMWQLYGGHDDYPWFGRAYTCALEPFTSHPGLGIKRAVEDGTAVILGPEEVRETDLVAVAYEGEGVSRIAADGTVEH